MSSVSFAFDCIDERSFEALKSLSFSATGTRRLCLHKNSSSGLQMMLIEIMSNTVFPSHNHESSDEAVFILDGSLLYKFIDGQERSLCPNETRSLLIPKGKYHSVESGETGAIYLELLFKF